jgi:hypothetical protein
MHVALTLVAECLQRARQVHEQSFELISMSSDGIHDAVFVCREKGRTPARSIDAAIVKEPAYGCDCRLANGIYRCVLDLAACLGVALL